MPSMVLPLLPQFKLPRLPALQWPRTPGQPASLAQCATLALLLHLLLMVVFGSAPGGTALPGEGIWGAINVRLRSHEPGPAEPGNVAPDIDTGPAGDALRRRWGGAVRSAEQPQPDPRTPGAANVGTWAASPRAAALEPAPSPPAERESATPATGSPVTPQARIGFKAPVGPPQLTAPPAAPSAEPLPRTEPGLPIEAAPREAQLPSVSPVERTALPSLERETAAPTLARPLVAPAVPLAPIEKLAAAVAQPAAPVEAAADRTLAADAIGAQEPAPLSAIDKAPAPAPLPRLERVDGVPLRALPTPGAAAGTLRSDDTGARPGAGAPDAGARPGHDVATAPSAPASAPRLNLELARPRGGEISSQGSQGLLRLLPAPAERKNKLAEDIEKSAKKDCRNAYGGMGLLAVIPLVVDAAKGGDGCRW